MSGQGGAAGQRERVAELVMMAREQGRECRLSLLTVVADEPEAG
ncbi:traI domain protein [Escherichia coli 178850]|nr:traI domain protein [Escherichia coli 178850]